MVFERFFDGRKVRGDGGEARPVLRLYSDLFGRVVEAGSHRAEFTFDPGDLRIGKRISAAVAALMAAGLIIPRVAPIRSGPRPGGSVSSVG